MTKYDCIAVCVLFVSVLFVSVAAMLCCMFLSGCTCGVAN